MELTATVASCFLWAITILINIFFDPHRVVIQVSLPSSILPRSSSKPGKNKMYLSRNANYSSSQYFGLREVRPLASMFCVFFDENFLVYLRHPRFLISIHLFDCMWILLAGVLSCRILSLSCGQQVCSFVRDFLFGVGSVECMQASPQKALDVRQPFSASLVSENLPTHGGLNCWLDYAASAFNLLLNFGSSQEYQWNTMWVSEFDFVVHCGPKSYNR